MASSQDFVEYVCGQMRDAGVITYKKMFGEYGVYCDSKIFALVCDNQLFVKITEAGRQLMPDCETGAPYSGAKPHFLIADLEDTQLLSEMVAKTCAELPVAKPKKKKSV